MEHVTRFGISLPIAVLKKYDEIIKQKGYSNRSKAILDLVREYIKQETTAKKSNYIFGIRYNHRHIKDISEIENSYPCTVISSFNFHIDLNYSFKILSLYGEEAKIKKIIAKYEILGNEKDIIITNIPEF